MVSSVRYHAVLYIQAIIVPLHNCLNYCDFYVMDMIVSKKFTVDLLSGVVAVIKNPGARLFRPRIVEMVLIIFDWQIMLVQCPELGHQCAQSRSTTGSFLDQLLLYVVALPTIVGGLCWQDGEPRSEHQQHE